MLAAGGSACAPLMGRWGVRRLRPARSSRRPLRVFPDGGCKDSSSPRGAPGLGSPVCGAGSPALFQGDLQHRAPLPGFSHYLWVWGQLVSCPRPSGQSLGTPSVSLVVGAPFSWSQGVLEAGQWFVLPVWAWVQRPQRFPDAPCWAPPLPPSLRPPPPLLPPRLSSSGPAALGDGLSLPAALPVV